MRYGIYDVETRSVLDLRQFGAHNYARDPSTDIWFVSFCVISDGVPGPILTWQTGEPPPAEIIDLHADPEGLIAAFNDAFERQIEQNILAPRYDWPIFPLERRRCLQASALSFALPASLDRVAEALKLPTRKTKQGKAAMMKLARPRKPRPGEDPTKIYWHDDPNLIATLKSYNQDDVGNAVKIAEILGFIPPHEQDIWTFDAGVNDRGLGFDIPLIDAAINIIEEVSIESKEKLATLTNGDISSPAQTQRILKWCAEHGCPIPNTQKKTVEETLARSDLAPEVRQLLTLRQEGAQAAANKFMTMRRWLNGGSRIYQCFRYHGAMPGRFTSIGVQVQNLKKPEVENVTAAIDAVRTGSLKHMQSCGYKRPLEIVGDISRATVIAASGNRFFDVDLSGIESRGIALIANEFTKLDQWRKFDQTGQEENEPYYVFGTAGLNLDKGIARKYGKTGDLAFGYQGGTGAWRKMAPPGDTTPDHKVREFQKAWARAHPNIAKFWGVALRQAMNAIEDKDHERFTAARIAFQRDKQFLHLELPSGRRIRYPYPRLYEDIGFDGNPRRSFTFRDASGGRWEWYHVLKKRGAFGGLIAENATQAICRDIFCDAMLRLEAAGYHTVAHLHDQFVCEVAEGFGSLEEFIAIITAPPAWAPDFPIAAKGRITDRLIEIKPPKSASDDVPPPLDDEEEPAPVDEVIEPLPWEESELAATGTINTDSPPPPPPPPGDPPPPPEDEEPPSGNGRGNFEGFEDIGPQGGGHQDSYSRGEAPKGTASVSYIYKDAQGRLYMKVTRTDAKSFPTHHWDSNNGRWISGWPKTVIPYRLPELLAAPVTEAVWICEGEKDVDNVAALGLVATTNPGGAAKWQPELTQWFKGKQLAYVLEDNDDAGRAHTAKIIAALRGIVPTIAVISFPELPEKGDVSDWLAAGGNKQLLLARAEEAKKRASTRSYVTINLATATLRNLEWLWSGHLVRGNLELMAGIKGVGKSQIHCQYAGIATTGRPWPNGVPGIIPCRVIMVTAEDSTEDTLKPRLMAAYADLKLIEEFKGIRRNNRDEMFLLSEHLDILEEMIRDFGDVGLVTIDPITAYMGGGKNFDSHRATDVRSQLSPLKKLAEKTGVCFSALTHPAKNASSRALDHFMGSAAFIHTARVGHICVPEVIDDPNGGKRETGRYLFTNAANNIAAKQPTLAYKIDVVDVGYDPNGNIVKAPVIRWEGEVALNADEALAATRATKANHGTAQDFLSAILANGPARVTLIVERGAERGFSRDQLHRAKRALGVKAFKPRGEKDAPWLWALPQDVPEGTDVDED
jgi:DNA polymerase